MEANSSTPPPLAVPELSLVVLVGVSGSGKSTFAAQHFGPFEVISSDYCRGLVSNDVNDQSATKDAFELLHHIAGKRLAAGLLTVIDATNVQRDARRQLVELARAHDVLPVAIVLDLPEQLCIARNTDRPERPMFRTGGAAVVRRQLAQLQRSSGRSSARSSGESLPGLGKEGFRTVHVLHGVEEVQAASIVRTRLLTDRRDQHGPFDAIGDVHGCRAELEQLLDELGYAIVRDEGGRPVDAEHPQGRRAVFVGDLVDRGPDSPGVLRLVMGMVRAGHALCVPGNHEQKLVRALRGHQVQTGHGLAETLAQLAQEDDSFRAEVETFCTDLVSHLVLDDGRLVVAHAGLKEAYHGRASGRVRSFALYGDTTGESDEFGLPVRYPWARDYRGRAMVLYGHTPTPEPEWVNHTMCLDTGCVFGGRLTALRYPEKELVSVPAGRVWYESVKPFPVAASSASRPDPDLLDLDDVLGKRVVETATHGRVTIRDEQAAGALEVVSRYALPPQQVPYLPPAMAPAPTSRRPGVLEHPEGAFTAYHQTGVTQLVCQEKHMGSRAIAYVRREPAAGHGSTSGSVYSRTGRSFFDAALTEQLLERLRDAVTGAGLFDELGTDWVLLDGELLPWSAKAEELLRGQYAAVGAAARAALPVASAGLAAARARGLEVDELADRTRSRAVNAEAFTAAYRRYRWPTQGLHGVQFAPFQVLAGRGTTYADRDHGWHLALADRLVAAAPKLVRTTRRIGVDTTRPESREAAVEWWESLTGAGGEGMVVKPQGNLVRTERGLVQPGLKVRGRDYLRIVYGPDYTEPANLARLRERNLGLKRSLALREYALGLEALDRLVRGEPLHRVHEAVFAVLALESEPVDPRL